MAVEIPFEPSIPHQRISTQLDDVTYIIDARWNERAESWYLSLFADDETPIRTSMRVVLGAKLGFESASPDFPIGFIYAHDLSGEDREATLDDFGTRVVIIYLPASEVVV